MPWGRKKDRPIYTANVHYFGDVEALDVAPEDLDIRAWVEAPPAPDLSPGRDALIGLATMLAPQHLFMNANASSASVYPTVELLRSASNELLQGEDAARAYRAEGRAITVGGLPMGEIYDRFSARIPAVVNQPEGESKRIQEFALIETSDRNGGFWARSRAPEAGQAFFANSGQMLLIQHIAQQCDYEETVVPMAAGLGAFVTQFEAFEKVAEAEVLGEEPTEEYWASLETNILRLDWGLIGEVALSPNPREALAEALRS